jgi:hypothetical protein
VRTWLIGCSLLALVTGFITPAWGSTIHLNDFFSFPEGTITYTHGPHPRFVEGHGAGGLFLGGGTIALDFANRPDPEGGHDNGSLTMAGEIPELGIEGSLLSGRIVDVEGFGDIIRVTLVLEDAHPALGFNAGFAEWDAFIPIAVPAPAAGLLLGLGFVPLTARRWLRRL